jgi:hypothetical protein
MRRGGNVKGKAEVIRRWIVRMTAEESRKHQEWQAEMCRRKTQPLESRVDGDGVAKALDRVEQHFHRREVLIELMNDIIELVGDAPAQ